MCCSVGPCVFFFFFNDTATTEIYTLSLHDALPILHGSAVNAALLLSLSLALRRFPALPHRAQDEAPARSEEHTSELQSRPHLVCRLLLEKKKKNTQNQIEIARKPTTSNHTLLESQA